jgi:L-threonylcarbamoyladenylate synthase
VYRNFLPGPVTVISQSKNKVAKGLSSEKNTLGVRIPDYKLVREIIKEFGKPITMTSANLSGRKTPYEIDDVLNNISDKSKSLIDLIIDGGKLPSNPPSSVIDTTNEGVVSIREGSIDFSKKVETYDVKSVEEMRGLGETFIKENKKDKAVVILFNAEMGAGKTQFVKGVGVGLGIPEIIKSPTYTLLCEYEYIGGRLMHMDAWRMEGEVEFRDLIEESFFDNGNVIAIEWAGSLSKWILEIQKKDVDIFVINIEYDGESKRKVWIQKIK